MANYLLTRKTTISAFYRAWVNMKTRCTNKKISNYARYGGRGITVCREWETFDGFVEDMFESYKEGLTLDRIDNDQGYSKENCRWATVKEQAENRTSTHLFEYKGISDTLTNWAEYFGIKRSALAQRVYIYKWVFEKATNTPIRRRRVFQ